MPSPAPATLRACACLVLAAAIAPAARGEKTVVVRSVVDYMYAKQQRENPGQIETYVFARGRYFNDTPMDRYLARMEFRTIATTLAQDLRKNSYLPAPSLLDADLVLVVHWGVTQAIETAADATQYDQDLVRVAANAAEEARTQLDDPAVRNNLEAVKQAQLEATQAQLDLRNQTSLSLSMNRRDEGHQQSNMELLGLQNALYEADKGMFVSELGETLRLMINEERYFIVVMAYDAKALREGRKRRVWTMRGSIRAAGVNFAIALDRISGAAANAFGRPQSGLAFEIGKDRRVKEGKVEIGEITVLGEASLPASARKQ